MLVGPARAAVRDGHAGWFRRFGTDLAEWGSTTTAGRRDLDLVARFDEEWRRFSIVGTAEFEAVFRQYFDLVPDAPPEPPSLVLDAGCGGGRWAHQMQQRGARVIALDLGRSVEVAERNTRSGGRVACVQGDVRTPPLRESSFDLVYSLGVLHHIEETELALARLARLVRPQGRFLLYLYYALETRGLAYRALFRIVDGVRRLLSASPQPVTVAGATLIATGLYWPLARLSRGVRALGQHRLAERIPLSFYQDSSFQVMRNDSLDRFGTRLEKRYTRQQLASLMAEAGLTGIEVSPRAPYWHAVGTRPA